MINLEDEKNRLTEKLSEQYSQNVISMDEYERLLEYVNKIETSREISFINNMIHANRAPNAIPSDRADQPPISRFLEAIAEPLTNLALASKKHEEHTALFSARTTSLEPKTGKAGKFTCLFGSHKIIIDSLPRGKTEIKVECLFGQIEIVVAHNIRVVNKTTPLFSGIFFPDDNYQSSESLSELHIKGEVVFGNVTVRRL